jgi:hypothetical protein
VENAKHYRAKSAEMARLADAATPDMVGHWIRMAAEWAALARRTEREDRFVRRYSPEG